MGDAWIYSRRSEGAGVAARMLAELGFSPQRVEVDDAGEGDTLRPAEQQGATGRGPELAMVFDAAGSASRLCARLRCDEELGGVPILVSLSSEQLSPEQDLKDAHELIVSPFTTAELSARINRARLAAHGPEHGELIRSDSLALNVTTYQVAVDGRPVHFTYMEYELLKFLMTHPRRVFSREALLSSVWGYDFYGGARTVDVHVRRIRAKLGSRHAVKLKTVRRVGYRFEL